MRHGWSQDLAPAKAGAERFLTDMRTRLADFALTRQRADRLMQHRSASRLDPGQTRRIAFRRHAGKNRTARGPGKPETFGFFGFTHTCGRTRRGGFQLWRKFRSDRVRARLPSIEEDLRRRMHESVDAQGAWLRRNAMGFNAYRAVPVNAAALWDFRFNVAGIWRRTLLARSQKAKMMRQRMDVLRDRWLPEPHITHPWPDKRFAVKHPGWEPYAGIPPVRICAVGAWRHASRPRLPSWGLGKAP